MYKIDKTSIATVKDISDLYTVAIHPTEWKWYYLDPVTSPTYKTESTNHLWMSLMGMYDQSSLNMLNQPYAYGGVLDTSLADLVSAFGTYGAYVFSINQEQYRVETNGYNLAINIPLNSAYTGMTSGLTATTLYSSFFYTEGCLGKDTSSLCSGAKIDMVTSEPSRIFETYGIGYSYVEGSNPNPADTDYPYFQSKVVPLFSDSIYYTFTGSTGTSVSWSTGYGETNRYGRFNGQLAGFRAGQTNPTRWNTSYGYDRVVGLYYIDKGVGVLFSPEIVNALDLTAFSGSFYTGATPTHSGTTFVVTSDIDYSTQLKINLTIPSDEPNATSNPSYIGQNDGCDLAVDKICLHASDGSVVAIAQLDEALVMGNVQPLEFMLPLDSGINENGLNLRGRIDPGFTI